MTTAIKKRPILFNADADMVRAILDGRKTQTRRPVKGPPNSWEDSYCLGVHKGIWGIHKSIDDNGDGDVWRGKSPFGAPGDRLWIKTGYQTRYSEEFDQTIWETPFHWFTTRGEACSKSGRRKRDGGHPGMFMPNWLSQEMRLPELEVLSVRIERVQDISDDDVDAEGIYDRSGVHLPDCTYPTDHNGCPECRCGDNSPQEQFAELWDSICPKTGWESNPWVWVVEFKVL